MLAFATAPAEGAVAEDAHLRITKGLRTYSTSPGPPPASVDPATPVAGRFDDGIGYLRIDSWDASVRLREVYRTLENARRRQLR